MKRGIVTILAVVALMMPVLADAASNPWDKKLPFKSATIKYDLSGMETGQEVLYVRKHGKETARYHDASMSVLGMTMKNRTVEITTPDWMYSFDLEEGTGTKSVNPLKLMKLEYEKLSRSDKKKVLENSKKMGPHIMDGLQGSIEPNAKKIMGYSCDRVAMSGITVYSIHDTPIVLNSESNMMGITIKMVATDIDKGSVADKHFQFPEGLEPQTDPEADQMAQAMAEQTMAMLKDPEGFKKNNQGSMMIPQGRIKDIPPEEQQQMEDAMKALKNLFGN